MRHAEDMHRVFTYLVLFVCGFNCMHAWLTCLWWFLGVQYCAVLVGSFSICCMISIYILIVYLLAFCVQFIRVLLRMHSFLVVFDARFKIICCLPLVLIWLSFLPRFPLCSLLHIILVFNDLVWLIINVVKQLCILF